MARNPEPLRTMSRRCRATRPPVPRTQTGGNGCPADGPATRCMGADSRAVAGRRQIPAGFGEGLVAKRIGLIERRSIMDATTGRATVSTRPGAACGGARAGRAVDEGLNAGWGKRISGRVDLRGQGPGDGNPQRGDAGWWGAKTRARRGRERRRGESGGVGRRGGKGGASGGGWIEVAREPGVDRRTVVKWRGLTRGRGSWAGSKSLRRVTDG